MKKAQDRISLAVALIVGTFLVQAAEAQTPPPGVFSEIQTTVVPRPSPALEPATVRTRVVQVDTREITVARRGREVLTLNLFDDAVMEVRIQRVRPTRNGYFISGRPRGMEWGEVRLAVNGPVMVGTVDTAEGKFTIRSVGSGQHVIREIDPLKESLECAAEDAALPVPPEQVVSPVDSPQLLSTAPSVLADEDPTEDGSEVRVLVVYTRALQVEQGGTAGMTALIDLMIQSANQAFEDSGINPRLVLAHSAMVDYVALGTRSDLSRLRLPDDGHLDEIHELRDEHAADLVHLLTNVTGVAVGSAARLLTESLASESSDAFAVTANASEETFAHEIGHNFGLRHDRFVESPEHAIYPYAFGYSNTRAFEAGAPESARWRTIMAYRNRCAQEGLNCPRLMRFSNPDQTYLGDPMGVSADSSATGANGPADARLTMNTSARWVASFRSEECTDFTVSPSAPVATLDGGEVLLEVDAAPGCLWEASSQSDSFSITAGALSAGPGIVSVEVGENQTGEERTTTLTVAGKSVTVRQLATAEGICSRSPIITRTLTERFGRSDIGECDEITDANLAQITSLSIRNKGISALKAGDFEGLTGLHSLTLEGNRLTTLPEGVFDGLSNLKELRLNENRLTELPKGVFEGLTILENLNLEDNRLAEVPEGIFTGFPNLVLLSLSRNPFTELPGGVFKGLSTLQYLYLEGTGLTELPAELFRELSSLEYLYMTGNPFTEVPEGLLQGPSNLKYISLDTNRLTELPAGLFAGLSNLEEIVLGFSRYTTLPAKIFNGLSSLKTLGIVVNPISVLPAGIFNGLSSLEHLRLNQNELSDLPAGIFSDLSRLRHLELSINDFQTVRSDMFQGLSGLERLDLRHGELTHLPADAFTQLTGLRYLNLYGNDLNDLPDGVLSGLASLETLFFGINEFRRMPDGVFIGLSRLSEVGVERNPVDPLPLSIVLEKVGQDQFKAMAPSGAPFTLSVPLSVSAGGSIEGDSDSVTIQAGDSESPLLRVTRDSTAQDAISVDIGTLPNLPDGHQGYALAKDEALPLVVLPSSLPTDAALIDLSLSHGALDPAFATDTASYATLVQNEVSSITVSSSTRNENASVTFLDGSGQELADTDARTEDHQVNLSIGENTIQVRVTAEDGTSTQNYSLVVTRDGAANVCGRNEEVRDAIIAEVVGIDACNDLTSAHLAAITNLDLSRRRILSLQAGDFAGLSALEQLSLYNNQLRELPSGVFSGLDSLTSLSLDGNPLTNVRADTFSGLISLKQLHLNSSRLSTLPAEAFSGLEELEEIHISLNRLSDLPQGIFSGLDSLKVLNLVGNRLRRLPQGLFTGVPTLDELNLDDNAVNPLPLPVSLEKVGDTRFKAVAASGVPFDVEVSVRVSATGSIDGGARTVTIPAGSAESPLVGVSRVAGTEDAVTADIASLSTLPDRHDGYFLQKDETLPRVILPGPKDPPPVQVTGVEITPGVDQIAVSWSEVSGAGGYKVQWKSGEETFDESRQVVIVGGATTSHTIVGLAPGTEYRIRVIATKENADDGAPSAEVTGVPMALSLDQVTGLEVTAGIEQLHVSWDEVSDADGYKVQWKSGTQDYDVARQGVVSGGDTVSYTITDLTADTEYTLRVIATREHADDGEPSGEVTATPLSANPDVNGDGTLDGNDALIMYHSYASEDRVGDGETGGTAASRQTLLSGYSGKANPTDDELKEMIRKALAWQDAGVNAGGDINEDGEIDDEDAYVMYQAYANASLVGNGTTGGTARFRELLLASFANKENPTDEDLKAMLRRANKLREDFG
ncbi:MAG: leucine-rich repeat protein [Gammaproteobacteria bacterium]|nr:leucine-rich repeat protein [Gammaproteobacteria bacterium]